MKILSGSLRYEFRSTSWSRRTNKSAWRPQIFQTNWSPRIFYLRNNFGPVFWSRFFFHLAHSKHKSAPWTVLDLQVSEAPPWTRLRRDNVSGQHSVHDMAQREERPRSRLHYIKPAQPIGTVSSPSPRLPLTSGVRSSCNKQVQVMCSMEYPPNVLLWACVCVSKKIQVTSGIFHEKSRVSIE